MFRCKTLNAPDPLLNNHRVPWQVVINQHISDPQIDAAAIADDVARRLLAAITQALADSEPKARRSRRAAADRVRVLVEVYTAFADEHPALYQTLMTDMAEAEAGLPKPLGHDLLWDQVIAVIAPLTGLKKAPAGAVTLWGLLHGLWELQRANLLGGKKPADVVGFGVDALIKGLTS
jgi:Tetracyclin repressor-like, C-terminal domain